ncbi:MAG: radical SAM protein [Bacilli bacterium]
MLTLITKNNFNIIINVKTGKYLSFFYTKKEEIINDINISKLKEIFPNYEEFKDKLLDVINSSEKDNNKLKKMNYLILHTSDACNMKCKYCYAADNLCDKKSNLMDCETMIKSINKFFDGYDFFVLFHGREPLTNYEEIIKTLKHFKNNKKIHFILQTNGLLLNEERIKELTKYNISINISIDGITDENNLLRINGKSINYTNRIKELLEKYKISPIIIVHKNNYKDLNNITNYLKKNNILGASYNFLWPTKENKELNEYVVSNEDLYKVMKEVFDNSIENNKFVFKERELYLLYGKILKRDLYNYMCNQSPCGAGKNCISVYKDGKIYPCTMVNSQEENYLGDLNDSNEDILNREVILKKRDINAIEDCKNCPLKLFCRGGGCSGFIYNLNGDINAKSLYCDYYYNIIIHIIKKIQLMSTEKYFVNY